MKQHWTIARLLTVAAAALSLMTIAGVAAVLWSTSQLIDVLELQTRVLLEDQRTADRIVRLVRRQIDEARDGQVHPDRQAAFRSLGDSVHTDISHYIGRDLPVPERMAAARIKDLHSLVEASLQRPSTIGQVMLRRRAQVDSLRTALFSLIAMRQGRYASLAAENTGRVKLLLLTSSAIGVIILLTAFLILGLLYRRVVLRLKSIAGATTRVGAGDFSARVMESENDELADVTRGFNVMARQLHEGSVHAQEMNSALRDSEERYRSLFRRVPVGLYRSLPDGRYLDTNSRFLAVMGHTDTDALREARVSEVIDPVVRRQWQDAMEQTDGVLEIVWGLTAPDGTERWVHEAARAIRNERGTIEYYEGAVRDITDAVLTERALRSSEATHRDLEKQLMQAQKMEAIGRLAGGIAHDFNNLLTAISGYADLLHDDDHETSRSRSDILEIQKAVERGGRLTSQLLAFSSYRVVAAGPNDLSAVTRDVDQMLRRLIGENITLRTDLASDVWVDPDMAQLEQLLLNLAVNARDAFEDAGTIDIRVDTVLLDVAQARPLGLSAGSYGRLSVRDNGCGMSAETITHVFEPFFTTKPIGQGTGLGLATVYGIIQQARGGIDVESTVGEGSTFTIYLPRTARSAHAGRVASSGASDTGGSELLLVVEDESAIRALAKRILERNGYRVLTATHGADAIELVATLDRAPDMMITDVVMPEMGGRALAERMAVIAPGMKVLYMSGYTADAFTPADGLLPIHFIEKPFTPAELVRKIRAVLDDANWMSTI